MKKVVINENQKGLLFRNGKFEKLLGAGKYYCYGGRVIEVLSLFQPVQSENCALETLLADPEIAGAVAVVEVSDTNMALHFVNGLFSEILRPGKYAFWSCIDQHEFRQVDVTNPVIPSDIPSEVIARLPLSVYHRVEVAPYQKARLYFNQKLTALLEPGVYYYWRNHIQIETELVDTRLIQMNITGQEIMTRDKVSLRINFVCTYRITDLIKISTEIEDYEEQMHVAAQLAMREYVGKYGLDEILDAKAEISAFVLERLKAREKDLFVEITDAGVKDLILPGEVREIMNTVLLAEKRAQANVITRREEIASTRSLLNTARLMEENQTLYKLKELEYMERICEKVGNINLGGSGDALSQLMALLTRQTS